MISAALGERGGERELKRRRLSGKSKKCFEERIIPGLENLKVGNEFMARARGAAFATRKKEREVFSHPKKGRDLISGRSPRNLLGP